MIGFNDLRVLVLGGSGFIGKNLCRALVKQKAKVRCFSIDDPFLDGFLNDVKDQIEWVNGDFHDMPLLKKSLRDIDIIYHLISTTVPATSNNDLVFDVTSNVVTTLSLLEIVKNSSVQSMIFVSSGGTIYGIPESLPLNEGHTKNPICGYGIQKLTIEKYLYLFNYLYKLDYKVIRLANPYGKNQISERPQGAIGNFIYKAIKRRPLEIWGDGKVVRDYIHIDDAVDVMLDLVGYRGPYRIFNIGSGKGHNLLEIIAMIGEAFQDNLIVRFRPARDFDLPINVLDISLAESELGWKPKVDLREGIKNLVKYGLMTVKSNQGGDFEDFGN